MTEYEKDRAPLFPEKIPRNKKPMVNSLSVYTKIPRSRQWWNVSSGYDIRTIQELLSHSYVGTTIIYAHTIKSKTKKEAESPLDF
jgi:hypothetical protein